MKERAPYMPFFGRDFYGDLNVMSQDLEEQGAYIRLSWLCWQEGGIPADIPTLAAICSNTPVARFRKKIWPKLSGLFETAPDGRLTHRKIESIRDGKESFRRKCSEGGKLGNERRWGKHRVPDADPINTRLAPESGIDRKTVAFNCIYNSDTTTPQKTRGCDGELVPPERSELDTTMDRVAQSIHGRHPAVRRDCGAAAVRKKLVAILKHKSVPSSERVSFLQALDETHGRMCLSPQWTKDGGAFAKSLENWLAPTMERYEAAPTAQSAPPAAVKNIDQLRAEREQRRRDEGFADA